MKYLAILGLLTVSSVTTAKLTGELEVHIRPEYIKINNDLSDSGNKDVAKFQSEYNKIYLKGKVNDTLDYKFRYNFNTLGDSKSVTDGTIDRLEYAYLSQKLGSDFSLHFGKMWYLFGGREYDYNGIDVYTYSEASNQIPFYEMGAMLEYGIANQYFYLQVSNPDDVDSGSGTKDVSNKVGTAVAWYGNFFDGKVKPIISVGYRPFSQQERDDTHYALGVQLNHKKLQLEVDYLSINSNVKDSSSENDYASLVTLLRYQVTDKFRPHLKYINDVKETENVKQYVRHSYDFALEYFPTADDNYNFHLVYSGQHRKGKAQGQKNSNTNSIRFGVKLMHNLLSM